LKKSQAFSHDFARRRIASRRHFLRDVSVERIRQ